MTPSLSLDGDALFIVSHLVRKIIEEIRSKKSNIKQIFVFTHNVYFHQEVSSKNEKDLAQFNDETFWILRKENDFSTIVRYDRNPIKSSYELLWREVKENPDSITLDITLRRIIETYFKAFGGIAADDILNQLDDQDKRTARSLLAWTNAGGQAITDDLYVTSEKDQYLKVFRNIFDKTNHLEHYQMMMGLGQGA